MKKYSILLLLLVLNMAFVIAAPTISPVNTPTGVTYDSNVVLEYDITQDDSTIPDHIKFSWDGTEYITYNNSDVILDYDFNNVSALGEDDNTVVDISGNGRGLTVTGATPITTSNGGFNLDGAGDFMENSSQNFVLYDGNNDFTFSIKFKLNVTNCGSEEAIVSFGNSSNVFRIYCNVNDMFMFYRNATGSAKYIFFDNVENSYDFTTQTLTFSYNGTHMYRYRDGVLDTDGLNEIRDMTGNNALSVLENEMRIGRNIGAGGYLEGDVYEFTLWNKSLSASEILDLHQGEVSKLDDGEYNFWSNKSINNLGLNSTTPTRDYDYYVCSTNTLSQETCSTTSTVSAAVSLNTIFANFTTTIGTINPYFYGTNDQYNQLADNTDGYLDNTCDGTRETPHDFARHRALFEAAGMNHIRIWNYDIGRISLSEGVYNHTMIQNMLDTASYSNSIGADITFVAYGTPTWLANTTTGWCSQVHPNGYYQGDWASCPPTNVTKLAIVHDYILNNFTQVIAEDKINFIPYNEPWYLFFLDNLTTDDGIKAIEFAKIYNESYNVVKANHPNIEVGWSAYTTLQTDVMTNYLMDNVSVPADFVGLHYYDGTSYFKNPGWNIDDTINDLLADCSAYSYNCDKILFDEWDINIKNSLPEANYTMEVAYFYQYLINNIPNQTQAMKFKWGEVRSYDTCSGLFSEYPKKYPMFIESDNYLGQDYYTTLYFANSHSSGSVVYNSASQDDDLKVVSTANTGGLYITIMNIDPESKNLVLDTGGVLSSITNQLTGQTYTADENGVFSIGISDTYEILYLSYNPPASNQASLDICEDFGDAGDSFISFFIILIIVAIAGLILFIFMGGEGSSGIDLDGLSVMLVIGGVVLSIGATIVFRIGGC